MPWISVVGSLPRWIKFLVFGGANTVLTFAIFVLLGLAIRPWLAYGVAFLIGMFIVGTLSNRWVFQGKDTWKRKVLYVGWYLILFLIGQAIIAIVEPVGLDQLVFTSAVLITISVPLNFLGGKFIFRHRS